jgi:PAS domain S-box-containing protein
LDKGTIKTLLIEDNPGDVRLIRSYLSDTKHPAVEITDAATLDAGMRLLDENIYDVILLDLGLPDSLGFDTFAKVQNKNHSTPIVIISGLDDEQLAIDAVRRGAQDYLIKGEALDELLLRALRYAIERKRSELALRDQEERFRSVAESAADAIVTTDSLGKIQYSNQAAETLFGYSSDDILGKPLHHLIPEQHFETLTQAFGLAKTGKHKPVLLRDEEMEAVKADGTEVPVEISLSSWDTKEEQYFSAIIRDMTETRQAQKRAQRQDRLAAIGQLAAGIAHDFNNILGTIVMYSNLVAKTQTGISEKAQEQLATISQQALHGASLITQILDFSRKSVVERKPMDFSPFLEDFKKLLLRILPENIIIRLNYQDALYIANADPARMQQVFMNLALNARDAMPEGGELTFDISIAHIDKIIKIHLEELPPGNWLKISVSDTGMGISPENLPYIFEPFFTTKAPGEGTGLGLAQVYGLVKQHEGYVDVITELGHGTTIDIYFPLVGFPLAGKTIRNDIPLVEGSGERVLIVEDDETTRKAIGEILASLNYEVFLAENGQEALSLFNHEQSIPDLVLSDLVMPVVGGVALYQELSTTHPEIPMVVMTGYSVEDETRAMLEKNEVTWIKKPLSAQDIARLVHNALKQKNVRSDSIEKSSV